jgi:hypothetical protein
MMNNFEKGILLALSVMTTSVASEIEQPNYLTATQQFSITQKSDIHLTEFVIPFRGNMDFFIGKTNAKPYEFKIAVYSHTINEWYTKPWFNQPDVYIAEDGSFSFAVATGRIDGVSQSNVAVFIVPIDFVIPVSEGLEEIPQEVHDVAVFSIHFNR